MVCEEKREDRVMAEGRPLKSTFHENEQEVSFGNFKETAAGNKVVEEAPGYGAKRIRYSRWHSSEKIRDIMISSNSDSERNLF